MNRTATEKAVREFVDRIVEHNRRMFAQQSAEQGWCLTVGPTQESFYEFIAKELETYRADIIERACGQHDEFGRRVIPVEEARSSDKAAHRTDIGSEPTSPTLKSRSCVETAWVSVDTKPDKIQSALRGIRDIVKRRCDRIDLEVIREIIDTAIGPEDEHM